jgi:hypothetical protein
LIPAEAVLPRSYDDDVARWREFAASRDGKLFVAESVGDVLGMAALEYTTTEAEVGRSISGQTPTAMAQERRSFRRSWLLPPPSTSR